MTTFGSLKSSTDIDGEVTLTADFDALYDVAKLDLLQDWIALLQKKYTEVYDEMWEHADK